MFWGFDGATAWPKSLGAIDEAIYNGASPPLELLIYQYRKLFHLSYTQVLDEPVSELFTSLYIYAQIQKKQELESKHNG